MFGLDRATLPVSNNKDTVVLFENINKDMDDLFENQYSLTINYNHIFDLFETIQNKKRQDNDGTTTGPSFGIPGRLSGLPHPYIYKYMYIYELTD